jgi:hypothetical protein
MELETLKSEPKSWKHHPHARGLAGLDPALSPLELETVEFLLSKLWEQRTTNEMQRWCLDLMVAPPAIVVRVPLEELSEERVRGLRELTRKRAREGSEDRLVRCVRHPSDRRTGADSVEVNVGDSLTFEARIRFNFRDEEDEENDW